MSSMSLPGLSRNKLRLWLALFFLALAVPSAVLIQRAYSELKWESFYQYRLQAEELAARIDAKFVELINTEEARPFVDYAFLNIAGAIEANFVQRSPISAFPVATTIPGLIGYFQVDAQGVFSTPLLPQQDSSAASYGISRGELQQRTLLAERMQRILSENQLVRDEGGDVFSRQRSDADREQSPKQRPDEFAAAGATAVFADEGVARRQLSDDVASRKSQLPAAEQSSAQAAFDQLKEEPVAGEPKKKSISKLGRVEDLKLDYRYQARSKDQPLALGNSASKKRSVRKELSALPESVSTVIENEEKDARVIKPSGIRIRTFESEIDPFEISLLDSGQFVLFRKVWRDGQRFVQGALIEQQPLLDELISGAFREAALSRMSDLIVAYRGGVFKLFGGQVSRDYLPSAQELSGAVLHQVRLSAPLSELELIFNIRHLPAGPGASVITWAGTILVMVLCAGFYLLYRLAIKQIDLVHQQQDFVSAVSHELKTPLTSIRMYGELLREGWAAEDKKKTYYDYIYDESERLSRLISNVLQLSRMTRNELPVNLKSVVVSEIMDGIRSKVSSQTGQAGYKLNLACDPKALQTVIRIDTDYFTQIIINLVDNAIKFTAKAEKKQIDIGCRLERNGSILFTARDYGPGVSREQMKKIFRLFYRSENELTRETPGTGIGLALVQQLALAMNGQVDVVNKDPGVEFTVRFPVDSRGRSQVAYFPK